MYSKPYLVKEPWPSSHILLCSQYEDGQVSPQVFHRTFLPTILIGIHPTANIDIGVIFMLDADNGLNTKKFYLFRPQSH